MNFRTFLFSSACGMALCAGQAHAATPDDVVEFNSVDDFRTYAAGADLSLLPSFHLAAYYCDAPNTSAGAACPADGGEGLFVQKNGSAISCLAHDDGGSILVVTQGSGPTQKNFCFRRQNVNGDIRQFGATKGSDYDCSPTASGGKSADLCTAITATGTGHATSPWDALVAATQDAGLAKLTTAGVQVKIGETVTVPTDMDLDLGGGNPFGNRDNLLDIPGTMFLDEGTTLGMTDHTSVHNGILLPSWYTLPEHLDDYYEAIKDMVANGDTGLTCDGAGCTVHDLEIDGFDTAYDGKGSYNRLTNVTADGNVCFYMHDSGGGTKWTSTECVPNFTRGNGIPNQETFAVTQIVSNGGVCQVTVQNRAGDTTSRLDDIHDGYTVWGSGASSGDGGVNINDRFTADSVTGSGSTRTLNLAGSNCTDDSSGDYLVGPTPDATWKANDNKIAVSSTDQIHPGMIIRGVSGIANNTKVLGVWRGKNIVILDTPTGGTAQTTLTPVPIVSAKPTSLTACAEGDDQVIGACLTLDASARVDVGTSPGGVAASRSLADKFVVGDGKGVATGYLIGGAFKNATRPPLEEHDRDEVAGFTASMPSVWSHAIDFRIWNSNFTRITGASSDADGVYDDPNTTFLRADGDSNGASFVGSKGGKVGISVVTNLDKDSECLNFVASSSPVTFAKYTQFEVDSGCFIAQGMRPGSGNGYVADTASHVDLNGSYLLETNVYYESPVAQGKTSTLGATVTSGANNLINLSIDPSTDVQTPAPAPVEGADLQIVQADDTLARVLQDSFAKESVFTGRRANGTNATPSALADGDVIASFEGMGRTDTGYTASGTGGLSIEACEAWTSNNTCTASVFSATEKGQKDAGEIARVESAGLGIGTGEGVHAPLEVLNTPTTVVSSNISIRGTGTGNINVGSNAGFPSPGILLVDGELMSYTRSRTVGTRLTLTGRGLWGTTAATHADGSTLRIINLLVGNSTSALPQFAVTSGGGVWHLTTSGAPPAISGAASGGTIVGNDNAGRITLASGTISGSTVTLTFATPWANAPVCFAQNQSASTVTPWVLTSASTTAVTFTGAAAPSSSDVLSYTCTGFK